MKCILDTLYNYIIRYTQYTQRERDPKNIEMGFTFYVWGMLTI